MIRGAPFGKLFENATLDNFDVTERFNDEAHEACHRFLRREIDGLLLQGPVGVGKTHLLVGVAKAFAGAPPSEAPEEAPLVALPSLRELAESIDGSEGDLSSRPLLDRSESHSEAVVEYWPMLDLASELRAEVTRGDLVLSLRCRSCDLLVLDDLGREKMSEFILQELQRIIDWRYRQMLPVVIASNKKLLELRERYEEHTFSRLVESCAIVHIRGDDHRRLKKERKEASARS